MGFIKKQVNHLKGLFLAGGFSDLVDKNVPIKKKLKYLLIPGAVVVPGLVIPFISYPFTLVSGFFGYGTWAYSKYKAELLGNLAPTNSNSVDISGADTKKKKEDLRKKNKDKIKALEKQKKREKNKNIIFGKIGELTKLVSGFNVFVGLFYPPAVPLAALSLIGHTLIGKKEITHRQKEINLDNEIRELKSANEVLKQQIEALNNSQANTNSNTNGNTNTNTNTNTNSNANSNTRSNNTNNNNGNSTNQQTQNRRVNNSSRSNPVSSKIPTNHRGSQNKHGNTGNSTNSDYERAVELYIDSLTDDGRVVTSSPKVLTK